MRENHSTKRRNTWKAIARKLKIAKLRDQDYKGQPHRLSKFDFNIKKEDKKGDSIKDQKSALTESDTYD